MSDPDNNGQDGLTLCEAYRMSPPTEKLREAVARQFNMCPTDADYRIWCGYVSVNGTVETDARCSVRLDAVITVQPDPQGAEWDALRNAMRELLKTVPDDTHGGFSKDFYNDLNIVVRSEFSAERDRRWEAENA